MALWEPNPQSLSPKCTTQADTRRRCCLFVFYCIVCVVCVLSEFHNVVVECEYSPSPTFLSLTSRFLNCELCVVFVFHLIIYRHNIQMDSYYTSKVETQIEIAKAGDTTLNLFDCGVSHIPPQVFELTHLMELGLYNNKLTSIPEDISCLISLTVLDLRNNQISNIPHSISALTSLTELRLHNNQITSLPHTLSILTNIQRLILGGNNQLTHIRRGISALTRLEFLSLKDNPSLKYPPYSVVEGGQDIYTNCLDSVLEYISTHPQTYSRYGRREHYWSVIRLMYIGNKEDSCFNMVPPEVIAKIEYFVLCDPYVPSSLLEQAEMELGYLTNREERLLDICIEREERVVDQYEKTIKKLEKDKEKAVTQFREENRRLRALINASVLDGTDVEEDNHQQEETHKRG